MPKFQVNLGNLDVEIETAFEDREEVRVLVNQMFADHIGKVLITKGTTVIRLDNTDDESTGFPVPVD